MHWETKKIHVTYFIVRLLYWSGTKPHYLPGTSASASSQLCPVENNLMPQRQIGGGILWSPTSP
jgi:hypothetical protein